MTREEAVLILDPDNSEAALVRLEYYAGFGGEEAELRIIRDACRLAVKALRETGTWVSVEEKLPDAEEEVRLCCVTASGRHYQCQGFYVPPGTHRDDSGYSWDWECCEEYDEERDDYLVNPGWYESIHNWDEYSACGITDKVTHWMPLPGLPKEESL